ncbi:MAG: hypothetical protein IPN01_37515 [Deltaproteobacteria bacterium]|nr:hypothetical protein [Deltaproteobacteria bacterium]
MNPALVVETRGSVSARYAACRPISLPEPAVPTLTMSPKTSEAFSVSVVMMSPRMLPAESAITSVVITPMW